MHTYHPSTQKAEAGRSLNARPVWAIDWVPGQPSLSSEGHQKAGEDVIEQEDHDQPQQATELANFGHFILPLDQGRNFPLRLRKGTD